VVESPEEHLARLQALIAEEQAAPAAPVHPAASAATASAKARARSRPTTTEGKLGKGSAA
jgi:hypothetical protein